MAHPLLFDNVWLQQGKFESAEAYYQQVLAGTGGAAGQSGTSGKQNQPTNKGAASTLKSEIAQARQNIKKALDNDRLRIEVSKGAKIRNRYNQVRHLTQDINGKVKNSQLDTTNESREDSGSGMAADSQVMSRIKSLEAENSNLKRVAEDLQALVKRLDMRVSALEKGGGGEPVKAPEPKPTTKDDDDDSDFDPFASDDDDEAVDEETKKRLAEYHAKKAKKATVIAKSSLGIDVKPWDDETDLKKMEECVRSIEMDGLLWGQSKFLPVGYGIKKLQINAVIEDDKVSTDDLEEKITEFEDYVQSMDIAYFQKI